MAASEISFSRLFNAERLRIYPCGLLVLFLIFGAIIVGSAKDSVDRLGRPLGHDFIAFYSASNMTLKGDPAGAFKLSKIFVEQQHAVPAMELPVQWAYPPTFQLLSAPLGLMPYGVSYLVFMVSTFLVFAFALSHLPNIKKYRFALLCSPAVALCVYHGQNSMLSAALFAGGFALLKQNRRCT